MDTSNNTVIEEQACGCKTITYEGSVSYEPCLPCALKNAGLMLQQAGLRMEEADERRRAEAEQQAEELRRRSEETFGGSD